MTTTKKSLIRNGAAVSFLAAAFALAGATACSTQQSPKPGDRLVDGTVYAGNNFSATPADAPDLYDWAGGKRYCEDLTANGHDDWALPTKDQLNHLYENRNTGSFAGTFNGTDSFAGWYWSSTERATSHSSGPWIQRFKDGESRWVLMGNGKLSVRCVRAAPAIP